MFDIYFYILYTIVDNKKCSRVDEVKMTISGLRSVKLIGDRPANKTAGDEVREFLCSEYFTIYFPSLKNDQELLVTQFPEELENIKYSTMLVKKGGLISKYCSPCVAYE